MKVKYYKTALSLLMCLFILSGGINTSLTVSAAEPEPVRITRTVSAISSNIGEKFTITYNITGDEIKLPKTKNEIAVVIDCSGSMASALDGGSATATKPSRISIARSAAKSFISSFNNTNTRIIVIPFSDYVKDTSQFKSMTDSTSLDYFNKASTGYIDQKIVTSSATNTGDAFRMAYNMLNKYGSSDAKKYIVMMTDGEPHGITYQNNYSNYYLDAGVGDGFVTASTTYKATSNDSTVRTATGKDTFYHGFHFAKNMAAKIYSEKPAYKTFMIGFTKNISTSSGGNLYNNLDEIGAAAGASFVNSKYYPGTKWHFYEAQTASDLSSAYTDIAGIIKESLPFSYMRFTEKLPVGIDIDSEIIETKDGREYIKNTNLQIDTITENGSNRKMINGPLDAALKYKRSDAYYDYYQIDSTTLSFTIEVLATQDGQKLFEKNVTYIDYTYVLPDDTPISGTAYNGNEHTVTINRLNPAISMNNITVIRGEDGILSAAVSPYPVTNNKVTSWVKSPATGIITLTDNGDNTATIHGDECGVVQVTATTTSLNGWYNSVSATGNINVIDVNLGDMYILKGAEIPLRYTVQDNGQPYSINLTSSSYNSEYINVSGLSSGLSGTRITGLKATGSSPISLAVTAQFSGGTKTLTCNVHVVDFEITPLSINVDLWQKGQISYQKLAPDAATENRITYTLDFNGTNDPGYIVFDTTTYPNKWEVKGVKITNSTNAILDVDISFDGSGLGVPGQTVTKQVVIGVGKNKVDIN